jgi:hypothetical protein
MMTLREKLHAYMVAGMQGDKEEAYRIRQELEKYLSDGFAPRVWEFLKALEEVMEVWGGELEKARRLRQALKLFLNDGYKCVHVEEEGETEESEVFYKYYHKEFDL